MAYQSLYRRYRPSKFGEVAGQKHVIAAVQNAIREDRTGHAYLFSGPRGTGKTTTARIMAKALNCTNLSDEAEPCDTCDSCLGFIDGTSYDLHELDAASNNGVEAVRDLIAKVALGSPGRTKVYILDEVHMLTSAAENALLKTLEEPPDHVKFVLATTEPHKVVSTIRSRTQHLRFELLPADVMEAHVRWVAKDAELQIDDTIVAHVIREGGGSVRDTLSSLDQVVAAGGVRNADDAVGTILDAIADANPGQAIAGIENALRAGHEPRIVGETLLGRLRDTFLTVIGADVSHLSEIDATLARNLADAMPAARITRSLETIGTALVEMRQAPDPRIDLEVAVMRLTRPDLDTDVAALADRIERLERGAPPTATPTPTRPPVATSVQEQPAETIAKATDAAPTPTAAPAPTKSPADEAGGPAAAAREMLANKLDGPGSAKPSLGAIRRQKAEAQPETAVSETAVSAAAVSETAVSETAAPILDPPADEPVSEPVPQSPDAAPATPAQPVSATFDAIAAVWTDNILAEVPRRASVRFAGGTLVNDGAEGFAIALPNQIHADRCKDVRGEIDAALSKHFGQAVPMRLTVQGIDAAPAEPAPVDTFEEAASISLDELTDADEASDGAGRLAQMFPGAERVDPS